MENKYKFEHDDFINSYTIYKDEKTIAEFVNYSDAKEYCEFKNRKKIDKEIKNQIILANLISELCRDKNSKYGGSLAKGSKTKELEQAIEIIKILREQE